MLSFSAPMAEPAEALPHARAERRLRALAGKPRVLSRSLLVRLRFADEGLSTDHARPLTRADCEDGPRPCPFVGCRYHLYLDVRPKNGAVRFNYPRLEPEDLPESCALDVADRGSQTLETVGTLLNLTRERVRQMELELVKKLVSALADQQ